jgi:23S rRNA (guanosine2251-2'-O)-methyltransferase
MNRRPQKNHKRIAPRASSVGNHSSHNAHRGEHQRPSRAVNGVPLEELIMGRNCLQELLRHAPERLREVFFAETRDERSQAHSGRKVSLREEVEGAGIPIQQRRREELDVLVQSDSHQGVVARVAPRAMLSFEALVDRATEAEHFKLLALDGVLDPQNFGAVLRAAECFGIDAVVWSKNRAAPLGPVVSKVSVGASELVPLCPVGNLHSTLEKLKAAGVWTVGAVVAPGATPLQRFDPPNKWVLVMGSEGEGIQRLIEENLDFSVYISMFGHLSSLNVSQATAVMLHALAKPS